MKQVRLALVALLMVLTVPAAAQTAPSVTVNPNVLYRKMQPLRPPGQLPRWINRADCLADDVLTFRANVNVLNNSAYSFEVWAGPSSADCTRPEARGVAANTCWLVHRSIPTNRVYDVDIRAQDIVAQNYPSTINASGGPSTPGNGIVGLVPGTAADCDSGGSVSGLVLTFMYVQSSTVVGTAAKWDQTSFDVAPPPPPAERITVEPADSRLLVEWTASTTDDFLEWRIYCDPAPGAAGGATGDRCLDVPTVLEPGEIPSEDNLCGTTTGNTQRDGHAEGLENGVNYAVGVLGVDRVGNIGVLSEVQCGIPAPQPEVPEPGCGGFCTVSRREGPTPAAGFGALSLVGLGLLRRRGRAGWIPCKRRESPC